MQRLQQIAADSPRIKQVRGKGMMFGIELTREEPDGHWFSERLLDQGVLIKDTHHWVLRFTPPIVATREELEVALGKLSEVFAREPAGRPA
jgi:ornithine--oxo-acid transaminase